MLAHESGKSFKQVVNEALRLGLERGGTSQHRKPYRLEPVNLGEPRAGCDLDKALALAGELEDAEIARKLAERK